MDEQALHLALAGPRARNLRILHQRGLQFQKKVDRESERMDFEGAPPARLDPDYMVAKVKAFRESHPDDDEVEESNLPGKRTWGKLRHEILTEKFLHPQFF